MANRAATIKTITIRVLNIVGSTVEYCMLYDKTRTRHVFQVRDQVSLTTARSLVIGKGYAVTQHIIRGVGTCWDSAELV